MKHFEKTFIYTFWTSCYRVDFLTVTQIFELPFVYCIWVSFIIRKCIRVGKCCALCFNGTVVCSFNYLYCCSISIWFSEKPQLRFCFVICSLPCTFVDLDFTARTAAWTGPVSPVLRLPRQHELNGRNTTGLWPLNSTYQQCLSNSLLLLMAFECYYNRQYSFNFV